MHRTGLSIDGCCTEAKHCYRNEQKSSTNFLPRYAKIFNSFLFVFGLADINLNGFPRFNRCDGTATDHACNPLLLLSCRRSNFILRPSSSVAIPNPAILPAPLKMAILHPPKPNLAIFSSALQSSHINTYLAFNASYFLSPLFLFHSFPRKLSIFKMGDISSKSPGTVITHIVLFKYRPNITWTDLQTHFDGFLKLKERCLNNDGRSYMISLRAGKLLFHLITREERSG